MLCHSLFDPKRRADIAQAIAGGKDLALLLRRGRMDGRDWGLIEAAKKGNTKGVAELLERGADANARDEHGRTALAWASQNFIDSDIVQILISKGADVNAKDNNGESVLSLAGDEGENNATSILRKNGAK
jgi:hypothetical protein